MVISRPKPTGENPKAELERAGRRLHPGRCLQAATVTVAQESQPQARPAPLAAGRAIAPTVWRMLGMTEVEVAAICKTPI